MSEVINALSKKFTIRVKNAGAENKVVALLPGLFESNKIVSDGAGGYKIDNSDAASLKAAGVQVDYIAADNMSGDITCTSFNNKRTIDQFHKYIRTYKDPKGLRIRKMSIRSSSQAIFAKEMELLEYTPLAGTALESLNLDEFMGVFQSMNDKIEVDFDKQVGGMFIKYNTIMLVNMEAGTEATFTFLF